MKTNWTNELASLETHKQKIERQIAYVRELIRLEEEHSTDMTSINHAFSQGKKKPRKNKNTAPPSQSVSGAKTMKLPTLLATIGQQHPHSMGYEKIAELVKESGYKSNSNNFNNMIYQCLQKLCKKGVFKKDESTREYQFVEIPI